MDAGAILVQESVPVYPGDSLETLQVLYIAYLVIA